jgi:predicted transcriptional regulator
LTSTSSTSLRRSKGGKRRGLIITEAGRTLVQAETGSEGGSQPPAPSVAAPPENVSADDGFSAVRCGTKLALVIEMLSRKNGVTIAELMAATGWLPHTTRATLSGLRKKGHSIVTDKTDDVTRYRMAGAVQS